VQQTLILFFSAPANRSVLFKSLINNTKASDTRWEAYTKTTPAIAITYNSITGALTHVHTNDIEKGDKRSLHSSGENGRLKVCVKLEPWNRLLDQFQKTSEALQESRLGFSMYAKLYVSLDHFLKEI
jgi:hypothetical protein